MAVFKRALITILLVLARCFRWHSLSRKFIRLPSSLILGGIVIDVGQGESPLGRARGHKLAMALRTLMKGGF